MKGEIETWELEVEDKGVIIYSGVYECQTCHRKQIDTIIGVDLDDHNWKDQTINAVQLSNTEIFVRENYRPLAPNAKIKMRKPEQERKKARAALEVAYRFRRAEHRAKARADKSAWSFVMVDTEGVNEPNKTWTENESEID